NLMGGRIWAESELGKGSEFFFTAVLETTENFEEDRKVENLVGLRALVIDDNNTNLKILVKQLGSWGVRPTPFNNPELVQELIHDLAKFDVCIMDMQMPKMDGLELTKLIRKHHSQEDLPIVVLSSTGEHFMQDDSNLFNHFLTKPVKPSKLKSTLVKMVSPITSDTGQPGHVKKMVPMSNLKILIADDDEINLAVTAKLLENMGYHAEKALDGQQVLQKINTDKYDLILMDIEMPGLTGVEATKKIKTMYFDRQAPVIFALTGHSSKQDRKKFLSQGMDDLISKPVDETILNNKIGEWFDLESYL
ncbi:MAG: ATP-binding response regulator, partial [Flavobacteriales bacterium]